MPTIPPDIRTWLEIDLEAVRHNVGVVRRRIPAGAGILGVIKANAYGHGMSEVAQAIAPLVEYFGVANLAEAQELASLALGKEILLLGPCLPAERKTAIDARVICSISSAEEARAYAEEATDAPALFNFKIDTGMGRMGCWQDDAVAELQAIVKLPRSEVRMISTHLPVADEDANFTKRELIHFEELVRDLQKLAPNALIHSLNSAGVLEYPQHSAHLVRAGLMLYGSAYPPEQQDLLKPAMTWKARIVLLRNVPAGRSISYGRTFITERPLRVASLPIGYADGFARQASGHGAEVLVGGKRCPILGRVTMDQILVDVSEVPQVEVGDEVVIFGQQGSEEILARELAEAAQTISWDIFTGIKNRVRRFYFGL